MKTSAVPAASSCARSGLGSVTVTVRLVVSGTTAAVVLAERLLAVSSMPSVSITCWLTSSPVTRSTYEMTRCWASSPPWYCSAVSPLDVETYSFAVEAYSGVLAKREKCCRSHRDQDAGTDKCPAAAKNAQIVAQIHV